jgi:hypothetical protein
MVDFEGGLRPRREVIRVLHERGVSKADIARYLGVSYQIVQEVIAVTLAGQQTRGHEHVERARDLGARVPMRHPRRGLRPLDQLRIGPAVPHQGDRQDPHQ